MVSLHSRHTDAVAVTGAGGRLLVTDADAEALRRTMVAGLSAQYGNTIYSNLYNIL